MSSIVEVSFLAGSTYAGGVGVDITSPMAGSSTSIRPFKEPDHAIIIIDGSK
jgi:hypothetical protein